MTQVYFTKLSEHIADINGVLTPIWRISTIATDRIQAGKKFYVKASKIHVTLKKIYWTDSRFLIPESNVRLPQTANVNEKEQNMSLPSDPSVFQQIECGHCKRVNLVSIDPAIQGAHNCTNCRSTICIIAGKQLGLKHGSIALNAVKGPRK